MSFKVDKCLCFGRTFAELKAIADENGATSIVELQQFVQFGHNCQLCHPYVRRTLRTGQTVFHDLVTDEDEPPPCS